MTQSPELVYALHHRIRQVSLAVPDPGELTAWLDTSPDRSGPVPSRRTESKCAAVRTYGQSDLGRLNVEFISLTSSKIFHHLIVGA